MNSFDVKIAISALNDASKVFNQVESDAKKSSENVGSHFDGIGGHIHKLLSDLALFDLAMRGIERLTEPAKAVWDEMGKLESVAAQTNAALKSTGDVSGVTAEQVSKLADSLEQNSTASKATIQSAENMLLTFTNIGGRIFPQTTQAVLDFSTAMHLDANQAALQLGKALNDPIKGMTTLQREGVSFTQAQKDLVKQLVETGQGAKAQDMILKELQTEFGGSAKAASETFGGSLTKLKNEALTGVSEFLNTNLLPHLKDFIAFIESKVVPALQEFANTEVIPRLKDFASFVRDDVLPVLAEFWSWIQEKVVPALQNFWNGDVLPKFEQFKGILLDDVVPALKEFWTWTDQHVRPAIEKLIQFISDHKEILAALAAAIGAATVGWIAYTVAQTAATIAAAAFPVTALILGLTALALIVIEAVKRWDDLKTVWNEHRVLITTLLGPLGLIPASIAAIGIAVQEVIRHWNDLKQTATEVAQWIQEKFDGAKQWFETEWAKVAELLEAPLKTVASAAESLWNAIGDPILNGAKALLQWFDDHFKIADKIEGPLRALANSVGGIWDAIGAAISKALDQLPGPVKAALGFIGIKIGGGSGAQNSTDLGILQSGTGAAGAFGVGAINPGGGIGYQDIIRGLLGQGLSGDTATTLAAIFMAESGGSLTAASPAGAAGFAQLTPGFGGISEANRTGTSPEAIQAQFAAIAAGYRERENNGRSGFTAWNPWDYVGGGDPSVNFGEVYVGPGQGSYRSFLPNAQAAYGALAAASGPVPGASSTMASSFPTVAGIAGTTPKPGDAGLPTFTGDGANNFNTGKQADATTAAVKDLNAATTATRDLDAATRAYNKALDGIKSDQPVVNQALIDQEKAAQPGKIAEMTGAYNAYAAALGKLKADAESGAGKDTLALDNAAVNSTKETFTAAVQVVDDGNKQINADEKAWHDQRVSEMNELGSAIMTALKNQAQEQLDTTTTRIAAEKQALADETAAQIKSYQEQEQQQSRFLTWKLQQQQDAIAKEDEAIKTGLAKQDETIRTGLAQQEETEKASLSRRQQLQLNALDASTKSQVKAIQDQIDAPMKAAVASYKQALTTLAGGGKLDQSAIDALTKQYAAAGGSAPNTSMTAAQAQAELARLAFQAQKATLQDQIQAVKDAAALQKQIVVDEQKAETQALTDKYTKLKQTEADSYRQQQKDEADNFKQRSQNLANFYSGYMDGDGKWHDGLQQQNTAYYTGLQDAAKDAETKQNLIWDQELTDAKKLYHDTTTTYALEAQARQIIEGTSQDAIVNLLKAHNPDWQEAGHSFGRSMIDGLQASGVEDYVRQILGDVVITPNGSALPAELRGDRTAPGGTNTNIVTITINGSNLSQSQLEEAASNVITRSLGRDAMLAGKG